MLTGRPPFKESTKRCQFYKLYLTGKQDIFWKFNKKFGVVLDNNLMNLFNGMFEPDQTKRLTIEQIKNSSWYNNNDNLTSEDSFKEMTRRKKLIEEAQGDCSDDDDEEISYQAN